MIDNLEALLLKLAGMKKIAQEIVAAEYDDAAVFDWEGDNFIWLAMEHDGAGWGCGWLMKPDEATEFVIEVTGRTPIEAALALWARMVKG